MIRFQYTIDNKPLFTRPDGETLVDLTQKSVEWNQQLQIFFYTLVTPEYEMRADKLALSGYGSIDQVEKVLKFNDISNPFSIEKGDLFVFPDLFSANKNMVDQQAVDNKADVRQQYIDPSKETKQDPNLGSFDKRLRGKNTPKSPLPGKNVPALPPNFANMGDSEIRVEGGKIIFGPDVSKTGETCKEPISKSEFMARLIKNRINK